MNNAEQIGHAGGSPADERLLEEVAKVMDEVAGAFPDRTDIMTWMEELRKCLIPVGVSLNFTQSTFAAFPPLDAAGFRRVLQILNQIQDRWGEEYWRTIGSAVTSVRYLLGNLCHDVLGTKKDIDDLLPLCERSS